MFGYTVIKPWRRVRLSIRPLDLAESVPDHHHISSRTISTLLAVVSLSIASGFLCPAQRSRLACALDMGITTRPL